MNVVVAGGTGFLGRHITRALVEAGHRASVLTRNTSRVSKIPQLRGATAVRGDVTDPSSLAGALDGAQAIVAAVTFPNYPMELERKGLTFDRYDRQGTENLLREATRSGIERFVYISGAGVDPRSPKPWYRAKGVAEHAIKQSGIGYTILRPSWAYGPEDRALNKFVAFARFSPVVPMPAKTTGPQRIQPVYVGDIAEAVRRICERPEAQDTTFEIGGPDALTMKQVVRTMLEVMGKRRLVVPVPAQLLQLATAPLVVLPKPPMTPRGVDFAVQDGLVDTSALETVLDLHPLSLREGLARYLAA